MGTDQDFRSSMVQVRIGGRIYDAIYEPRCNTCTHPGRQLIEAAVLQNYSYRAIARDFSGKTVPGPEGADQVLPEIGHASIRNHFVQGHMPMEAAALRRLAEKRAEEIGSDYENAAEQFVDHHVLASAVVTKTYSRLVLGEIEPEVKDGIAAAKFLSEVERAAGGGGLDSEAWSQAMTIYFETARAIMPPDTWFQFTTALASNPILQAISERMDAQQGAIEGAS
jgi:hypothetical protein